MKFCVNFVKTINGYLIVEAKNAAEAQAKAEQTSGSEWEVESVEKVKRLRK